MSHQVWLALLSAGECILDGKKKGGGDFFIKAKGFIFYYRYSMIKKYMSKDNEGRLSPVQHLTASAEAGALTALIANPLWVIKTRMCTTTHNSPQAYKGLLDGLRRLYGEEGIRGLYRGIVPALFGVSHGAIQFMVYEEMKKKRNEVMQRNGTTSQEELNAKLSQTEYIVMAVVSKVIASVVTYPYQVLKSRLQVKQVVKGILHNTL